MRVPALSCVTGGIFGFVAYPYFTTITDFATQTTFPVGEGTSSGILLFGGQFGGVVLSIIFSFWFDGESLGLTRLLNGIMMIMFGISLIAILFSK